MRDKPNNDPIEGLNCSNLFEPVPIFNKAQCETVFEGKNNSSLVLGRDRPEGLSSGYGGIGAHKAGSFDLVAGRGGPFQLEKQNNQTVFIDNSFIYDSARIYGSQKTDIDDNFNLSTNKLEYSSKMKSGIGIKADQVRIMARNALRLFSSCDKYDSNGVLQSKIEGIDLIAGKDDSDLQPLSKGDNLLEYIKTLEKRVSSHNSEIAYLYSVLTELLGVLGSHTHQSAMGPTSPSIELAAQSITTSPQLGMHLLDRQIEAKNATINQQMFLEKYGWKFINSLNNRTT